MSAYIVDNSVIEKVISTARVSGEGLKLSYSGRVFKTHEELGQALLDMNTEAVNQRYEEKQEPAVFEISGGMRSITRSFARLPHPCTLMESYDAIKTLIYQCSEGSVYGSDFYQELLEHKSYVADQIIERMKSRGEEV